MQIIKSGNIYPSQRAACFLIEQKSAQKDVLSLVTIFPITKVIVTIDSEEGRPVRLPIEKGLHLDATEEGGTTDQSTKVTTSIDSEEGRKADQSTRVNNLTTSLTPARVG